MINFELELKKETIALEQHSLYGRINNLNALRFFMENHVFAVLDFMSLTKSIQVFFAPANSLWTPPKYPEMARFINEVVLAEESDTLPDGRYLSHFEMYLEAMREVGASTALIEKFLVELEQGHIEKAFQIEGLPIAGKEFTYATLQNISEWEIHQVVAAFCFGREKVIPLMFQSLMDKLGLDASACPLFRYYLQRHIDIDGDEHGPIAEKMLRLVCDTPQKESEALAAARSSLLQREAFWCSLENNFDKDLWQTTNTF